MQPVPSPALLDAIFRASPHYELLPFERLPPDQQELLGDLRNQPDFFGILRPRLSDGRSAKAVGSETARLYAGLAEPSLLPATTRTALGAGDAAELAELVLDGVLEIADGTRGFVSGPAAYALIYGQAPASSPLSATARLSEAALRYAQALGLDDANALSARLYCYNREPADARWRRALPDQQAVEAYLGLGAGSAATRLLERAWRPVGATPGSQGWLAWHAPGRSESLGTAVTYKLYVSARCEQLPRVFLATLRVLTELRAGYVKIGKDMYGLLRPDKLVAYFGSYAELETAAQALLPAIAGAPAQGVPFAAAFDADGLLCWGIDPPRSAQLLHWQPRESWRLWVTNRLALALLAARGATEMEPWRFAIERLRLEGIDTDTWSPRTTIWQQGDEREE